MADFQVRARLDPAPEQWAQLAAYPAADLWPDFAVVTSGALAIDLAGRAVAYRQGRLVPLAAGADEPAVWLPDYLGGFLPRLARAVADLRPDLPTTAHLLDAPAALTFRQTGAAVIVTYLDQGQPVATATVPLTDVRATVRAALTAFLTDLLAINPRLAGHPEVAALRRDLAVLAAPAEDPPC